MRQTLCTCSWLCSGLLLIAMEVTSLPGQQIKAPSAAFPLKQLAKELAAPTDQLILHDGKTLTVKPLSRPLSDADVDVPIETVPPNVDNEPMPRKNIARVEFFEDRWLEQYDKAVGKDPDIEQARAAEQLMLEMWRQHRLWRVSPPLAKNPWKKWETRIEERLESTRAGLLGRLIAQAQEGNVAALREALDLAERWFPVSAVDGPLRQQVGQAWSAWGKHLLKEGKFPDAAKVARRLEQNLVAVPADLVAGLDKEARLLITKASTMPGEAGETLLRQSGDLMPGLPELDEAWDNRGRRPGTLRIAIRSLPENMSPATASSDSERLVLPLLFETLEQVSAAAPRTGIVELPKELVSSEGWTLTATDVQHTLDLINRPDLPGRTGFFREFLDVRTLPNQARQLHATVRQGAWHEALFRFWLLPQRYRGKVLGQADDPAFAIAPAGTGPFRFAGRKGDKADLAAVFRPNLFHTRSRRPSIQEIRLQALAAPPPVAGPDAPHLAFNISSAEAKAWLKAGYRIQSVLPQGTFFLAVNHRVPALRNVSLRRALAQAIDRGQVLASYFSNKTPEQARPVNGPFRADTWAVSPSPRVPANLLNPETAKSLAKQAISELGAVELSLHFSREDPLAVHACKAIAEQVEQMLPGVRLKPTAVAPAELRELVHQGKYALAYLTLDDPEELSTLWSLFDTQPDALRPGGSNFLGYENDAPLQTGLRDLFRQRQFSELKSKFHDLHAHLNERMPLIPLWQAPTLVAVHPALQLPSLDGEPLLRRLAEWKLAKE